MKKEGGGEKKHKKLSKKWIIIIIIAVVVLAGIAAFFLLGEKGWSFINLPDFSAGSKLYDILAKLSGNSFENVKLNPFNQTNG